MREALRRTVVLGVQTNLGRLRAVVEHPQFEAGALHTGFIDEHLPELTPTQCPPLEAVAALAAALTRIRPPRSRPDSGRSTPDPWTSLGSWRLGEGS